MVCLVLRRIALLGVLWASGCAAPTLPLPPPTALAERPDASGLSRVSGDAIPGAFVGCLNLRTEEGVIVRAPDSGQYELFIPAVIGDDLDVWQFDSSAPGGEVRHVMVRDM